MNRIDLPPVWLLGALVLAWAQPQFLPGADFGALAHGLGTALGVAGLALMAVAAMEFVRWRTPVIPNRQPSKLLTTGVYRWSRNPIYLADLLLLAGLSMRWDSWAGLLLVPVLGLVLTARFILAEEARCQTGFGADWTAWSARTRRWL